MPTAADAENSPPTSATPALDALSARLRKFVGSYIGECRFVGYEAARAAGYVGDRRVLTVAGSRALARPDVQAAIKEALTIAAAPVAESLARTTARARVSLADFFEWTVDANGQVEAATARISIEKAISTGAIHFATRVRQSRWGWDITLCDAAGADALMLRANGVIGGSAIYEEMVEAERRRVAEALKRYVTDPDTLAALAAELDGDGTAAGGGVQ